MLGLFRRKEENNVSGELFKKEVSNINIRLDLLEDDIKRLRKRAKLPVIESPDEEIIKSLEEDGFKEIRQFQKKYGGEKALG